MTDESQRSTELIERLLADANLRARFRADAAAVLRDHGLGDIGDELGEGRRAMLTPVVTR